jgi:membrane protease YdiL (CAAX protease family)
MRYLPPGDHETLAALSADARRYPQIWRFVLGLVATPLTAIILLLCAVTVLSLIFQLVAPGVAESVLSTEADDATPFSTTLLLAGFILLIIGVKVAARIHNRTLASLFGIGHRLIPRHFITGLVVVLIFALLGAVLGGFSDAYVPNLTPTHWLVWLIPGLAAIFIQTLSEELIFRGYIQQQMTALSMNPLVWWILPSILFGFLHLNEATFGENKWLVVAAMTVMAMIASDVTARTGNISGAFGLHFGNNAIAIMVTGTPGPLSGLCLWLTPLDPSDVEATRASILASLLPMLVAYAIYVYVVTRRRALVA